MHMPPGTNGLMVERWANVIPKLTQDYDAERNDDRIEEERR